MTLPINPYIAGNPVGDSPAFVGRADVLREVVRVLRRSQDNAIVLYGQRRIGKTSILQHLAAQLLGEGLYRPVYFDLQDKADWPLDRVLRELARTVAHALDRPDPDLGPEPETSFHEEWLSTVLDGLPEGCSLVLLFDEFDVLADPKKEQAAAAFFPYLRGLLASDPRRLQFVFVIGRNVDDLDTIALSLFKGTPYQRVSLLKWEDTADLVRLSQANGTLVWSNEAVEQVWGLAHGHPFLTQQLCSHVWERAYDEEPGESPTATTEDVDAAVLDALEASRNTLEWLWDGLPPAERVVASALAEAGPDPITQEGLEQLLRESGVRIVIRELQNAPRLLQDWGLIEPADGGYRFRVELLRRWITEHKPLKRAQKELDRIKPVAESFYQAALGLYRGRQLDQATTPLRQAIKLNPNHVGANQLLAGILLAQGQPGEARELLERLYEYQPAAARSRLVQALLTLAQDADSNDEQLALYERVLEVDPTQPEAAAGRQRTWKQRGDAALESGDLEAALEAYQTAGLSNKAAEIEQKMRYRDLAVQLEELGVLEEEERYQDALHLAHRLVDEYPDILQDWTPELERLERKTHLADLYQRALKALQSGDRQAGIDSLVQVVDMEPEYEDATRYLHLAVTGVDVVELQAKLEAEEAPRPLSPWNPLDHLCLLWWVLVTPQRLKAYREAFGEKDERRVGKWLASALIWLPLFVLTLALGVGNLPHKEDLPLPTAYLWIGLGLAWVLLGLLGAGDFDSAIVVLVTGGAAFFAAGGVAGSLAVSPAFLVTVSATGIVATLMASSVALAVAGPVSGFAALGAAIGFAIVITLVWRFANVSVPVGIAIGTVAAGLAFAAFHVGRSLKTDRTSWLARGAFGLLLLAQAFLIWLSFLGGWRVFQ